MGHVVLCTTTSRAVGTRRNATRSQKSPTEDNHANTEIRRPVRSILINTHEKALLDGEDDGGLVERAKLQYGGDGGWLVGGDIAGHRLRCSRPRLCLALSPTDSNSASQKEIEAEPHNLVLSVANFGHLSEKPSKKI